jgi:hypothetical protein
MPARQRLQLFAMSGQRPRSSTLVGCRKVDQRLQRRRRRGFILRVFFGLYSENRLPRCCFGSRRQSDLSFCQAMLPLSDMTSDGRPRLVVCGVLHIGKV